MYSLLDLCGEHELKLVHVALDDAGKDLFKRLHEDYTRLHKYRGHV